MRIRINGKLYVCNNALEHIALYKQISDELDRLKMRRSVTPVISKKSVVIGNLSDNFSTEPVVDKTNVMITASGKSKKKLSEAFPKGVYSVSSVKKESDVNPEYDMALTHARMEDERFPEVKKASRKTLRKVVYYDVYNDLKKERGGIPLVDFSVLTDEEVINLKKNPLVFVSESLNHRIETGFYENCRLLKDVSTAAFIVGKAINPEKILKEAFKLIKLSKCTNTNIICYEANNDELRRVKDDKLFKAFDAMVGLSEILKEDGYTPLLCLDDDIKEKIQKLEPSYKVSIPVITRVSSKKLDNLKQEEDYIVMNSKNDYDELMLTSSTKNYLNDSRTIKTPSR